MRCPNCNAEVLDNVNFCHNCGYDLKTYRENLGLSEQDNSGNKDTYEEGQEKDFSKTTMYKGLADELRDIDEGIDREGEDKPKTSRFSKSIYEIFDLNSDGSKKKKSECKISADKKERQPKKGKSISDIFDFKDDSKSYSYDFEGGKKSDEKVYEQEVDNQAFDSDDTIYVTKGYDDYEQKTRRDESIRFTAPDKFTIFKEYTKNYDDDILNTRELSPISNFEEVTARLGSKLNKIVHPLVFNIIRGKGLGRKLNSLILFLASALPFFIYYTDISKGQRFFSKFLAIVVLIGMLLIDIGQKVVSYNMGLLAANKLIDQEVEKRDRKDIARLMASIESLLSLIFTVILGGSLVGFASSIFTETFLGNHPVLYVFLILLMVVISTNTLYGRYSHKDYLKVLGSNLFVNLVTRLVFFFITITLLEILVKQFVPILF